jgi:hypothetical protein
MQRDIFIGQFNDTSGIVIMQCRMVGRQLNNELEEIW